jgi:hypothetical protein
VGRIGIFLVMCDWLGAWCHRTKMLATAYFVVVRCLTCVMNKLSETESVDLDSLHSTENSLKFSWLG